MCARARGRVLPGLIVCLLGFASACQFREPPASAPSGEGRRLAEPGLLEGPGSEVRSVEAPRNEIPAAELEGVMAALFQGLGLMEQYEYRKAAEAFREVRRRAPGWIPGSINLAIALLNDSGVQAEAAKKAGGGAELSNFDEALQLLAEVLQRDPDNRHAHFCRGIILEQQGDLAEAHEHFKRVTELDPNDPAAWYWRASTLTDPEAPGQPAGPAQAREQIELFSKALERDPYLTPALYKLSFAYRLAGQPEKQKELLERWRLLNPDRQHPVPGPGNSAEKVYGEMGRYATVINPFSTGGQRSASAVPPRFAPAMPLEVKLGEGDRWALPSDFEGPHAVLGRIRARFGAAVAVLDADGDGKLDLYCASAIVGTQGLRDALLLNLGDGKFADATAEFNLPLNQASIGVAAADFDADRQIDLVLCGVGRNRLFRNRDGKSFEDLSAMIEGSGPPALCLSARWIDLDQDGDLDLYLVNYCAAEEADRAFFPEGPAPAGIPNTVYRNDGQPEPIPGSPASAWAPLAVAWENVKATSGLSLALVPWTGVEALLGGEERHTGIAVLDIDNDRDLDLVLTADGAAASVVLNDRLGNFHAAAASGLESLPELSGILAIDLDRDGRTDLVGPNRTGRVVALRNTTERSTAVETRISFEPFPTNAEGWRSAVASDLDLDGAFDLLGLPSPRIHSDHHQSSLQWARNEGTRLDVRELILGLEGSAIEGFALVDVEGDPLPELLIFRAGDAPVWAPNLGNGNHWLSVQLGGHWRVKPELMRTNSHGIGTRIVIEGKGVHVSYDHTTPEAGLAQSIGPIVFGLGARESAELIHLRWPDGVMQCELNVPGNQRLILAENNRKTGSCPVLFTWNGQRFVCVGDFLGGGGLGYLVAPGVFSQPDRDEAVAISSDQLKPEQGVFRISITEPMDEVAYLDHLMLDVVDCPPGVAATPDERFAPTGPRPTGKLLAWKRTIDPIHATDLAGRDMTETLKHWDRRTVDSFRKLAGWIGYAEEHGIILDFGDRLAKLSSRDPVLLCLAGWVEYPYSQTNYAAATAGVVLSPPAIERLRDDGTWEVIEPHAGYPAGLPRLTTLDLTGKLTGDRCVLRIRTNMECYYDQAFLAVRDPAAEAELRVTSLPVARAVLGHRGYTREISPDGRLPLIYDYDYVDPAPLARMSGRLTRYGDVARLLQTDDDQFCVIGPGDEAKVEFDANALPELPSGWSRSFVLRSYGYCKDADPFTAGSDTVEPLPWREMPEYPFAPGVSRPEDPAYAAYIKTYQTRLAGGGEVPRSR